MHLYGMQVFVLREKRNAKNNRRDHIGKKVWWLKINKKPVRKGSLDRAAFPYVVKIRYVVNGKEYIRRKWIGTKYPVPAEGDTVQLAYEENRPEKIKVVY